MEEIPVRHKTATGLVLVPGWSWVVGALATIAIIGLFIGVRMRAGRQTFQPAVVWAPVVHCAIDSECGDKQLCVSSTCAEIGAGLAGCAQAEVHFDTDSAELRSQDQQTVLRMARCLKADQSMKLAIAGNADARGSAEHNAELAEKRAMAVALALQKQGVSGNQLSGVSYGDNRPLCLDSDKDCWAKNQQAALLGLHARAPGQTAETPPVLAPSVRCAGDSECGEKQLCVNTACVEIKAGLAGCTDAEVHFDTNSAEIRVEDRQTVLRMARCLKADQSMKLAIAGNADARGSAGHNEELGEKRAMAVARALEAQGVSDKQLHVVSYGDNRPLCLDSDKDCWAKNRRASMIPQTAPPR